jgi:hypothetical protein
MKAIITKKKKEKIVRENKKFTIRRRGRERE